MLYPRRGHREGESKEVSGIHKKYDDTMLPGSQKIIAITRPWIQKCGEF